MKRKGILLTVLSCLAILFSLLAVGCGNSGNGAYIDVYFHGYASSADKDKEQGLPYEEECFYESFSESEFANVIFNPLYPDNHGGWGLKYDYSLEVPNGQKVEGWYTQEGVQYFDAQGNQTRTFTLEDDGLELYIRFEYIEYTLKFDTGEGGFENGETFEYTYTVDEVIPELPVPVIDDPSMEFSGWLHEYYDDKGIPLYYTRITNEYGRPIGNRTHEKAGLYSAETDVITVYADYDKKRFTVTLDYYDEAEAAGIFNIEYGTPTSEIGLSAYGKETEKQVVTGWSYSPYVWEEPPEYITGNITLYARWVNYKKVDFVCGENDVQKETVLEESGASFTLPVPERAGYRFEGWYETSDLSEIPIEKTPFDQLKDAYYAKWSVAEYQLTFVNDGGEAIGPLTYYYRDVKELPVPEERTGYVFEGWTESESSDGEGIFEISADMYGDKTLYAKWSLIVCKVELDGLGGIVENTVTIAYGSAYALPVPVKTGYTFLGWYSTPDVGGTRYTNSYGEGLSVWEGTEDVVIYARYTRVTYTVTYDTKGGEAVEAQQYRHGEYFKFPDPPAKEGFLFAGWVDADGVVYTETMTVNESITLYATWIESV